ncbi:IclR family transcriptional regulator [Cloacibacillus sp. An23]|uniref:IclR family transcriptional regulator n=1 Tax=Cloacibacillus sp. An23 TaxID=1965591 RepID=UPI0013028383|nr:IclR family transcriptional regulator [Cloacibacillus sp. An23]
MQTKQTESGTQAIQRALSILNCFVRETDSLSLAKISKLVGIPYSTASRIVGILEQESFLIRDKHTKRYSLGRRIYVLGYCAKQSDFLRKVIYSYLQKLRDEFEETAVIYIREDNYRVCLEKVSAFHSFKFSPAIGSRYVLWAGAGGRGFLAYASPQEQDSFINDSRNLTTFTNTDKKSIMKELYNLCKNGYAYCVNEYQEGFSSISGPIIDGDNNLLCTIAVTGPTSRFTPSIINGLKTRIPEYCLEISSTFGWNAETNQTNCLFPSPSLDYIMQCLN